MSGDRESWVEDLWLAWDGGPAVVLGCEGRVGEDGAGFPGELISIFAVKGEDGWETGVLLDAFRLPRDQRWSRAVSRPSGYDGLVLVRCEQRDVTELARISLIESLPDPSEPALSFVEDRISAETADEDEPVIFRHRRLPSKINPKNFLPPKPPLWAVLLPMSFDSVLGHRIHAGRATSVLPRRSATISVVPGPLARSPAQTAGEDDETPSILRMVHGGQSVSARLDLEIPARPGSLADVASGIVVGFVLQQSLIPMSSNLSPHLAMTPLSRVDIETWLGPGTVITATSEQACTAVNLVGALAGKVAVPAAISLAVLPRAVNADRLTVRVTFEGIGRGDLLIVLDAAADRLSGPARTQGPTSFLAFKVQHDELQQVAGDPNEEVLSPAWQAGIDFTYADDASAHRPGGEVSESGLAAWAHSPIFGNGQLFGRFRKFDGGINPLLMRAFEETLHEAVGGGAIAWGDKALPNFQQFLTDPAVVRMLVGHPHLVDVLRPGRTENVLTPELASDPLPLANRIAGALGAPARYDANVDGATQLQAIRTLLDNRGMLASMLTQTRVRFGTSHATLQELATDILPELQSAMSNPDLAVILDDFEEGAAASDLRRYASALQEGKDLDVSDAIGLAGTVRRAKTIIENETPRPVAAPAPASRGLGERSLEAFKAEFTELMEQAGKIGEPSVMDIVSKYTVEPAARRTRNYYNNANADLRAAIRKPATVRTVANILDQLETWAALPAGDRPAASNGYDVRLGEIAKLIDRANINLAGSEAHNGGALAAIQTNLNKAVTHELEKLMPASSVEALVRDNIASYARMLTLHKAYVMMRDAVIQRDSLFEPAETARLGRLLALWPHGADRAWAEYVKLNEKSGRGRDLERALAIPQFEKRAGSQRSPQREAN